MSWQLHISGFRALRNSLKLASRSYVASVVAYVYTKGLFLLLF